jgi:hypothetical protein
VSMFDDRGVCVCEVVCEVVCMFLCACVCVSVSARMRLVIMYMTN